MRQFRKPRERPIVWVQKPVETESSSSPRTPTMNRGFLSTVLARLRSRGADVVVFGGWAEELRGLRQSGLHSDVDLLYFGESLDPIDRLLDAATDLIEIREKRFFHKRAFVYRDIRVELFLVTEDGQGFFTLFWGTKHYRWPSDTHGSFIEGLPVAASAALTAFRRDHEGLKDAQGGSSTISTCPRRTNDVHRDSPQTFVLSRVARR